MFSLVSVCPRGVYIPVVDTPSDRHPPLGRHPPASGRHSPSRHPHQTAAAVDDTHPTGMHSCFYHPQRSCEGYVFTGMCLSTGGVCLSACWDTTTTPQTRNTQTHSTRHPPGPDHQPWTSHPPGPDTPWDQPPPQDQTTPLDQKPPGTRHPPGLDHPPGPATPLGSDTPPSTRPPGRDGYCCGRYASYWNAFLLFLYFRIIEPGCLE